MRRAVMLLAVTSAAAVLPLAPAPATTSAFAHLRAVVDLSEAPSYRRAGSPGMEAAADYVHGALSAAGYSVVRHDFAFESWEVDYSPGMSPSLERLGDGASFRSEAVFRTGSSGAEGVTCVLRLVSEVEDGDCGWIPFQDANPDWKNAPFVQAAALARRAEASGAAGVVVQGDVTRDTLFALTVTDLSVPAVVAVAHAEEVLGRTVRLRSNGSVVDEAPGRNVVGVLPSDRGRYVMLLAHADAWFQGAADNGAGVAAALRAAELLAAAPAGIGVLVAAVDAEEVGLVGSRRLAETLDEGLEVPGVGTVRTDDIVAVVNLDASSARASDVQDTVRGLTRTDAPLFSWRAMVFAEHPVLPSAFLARFASHGVLGLPMNAEVWKPFAGGYRSDVRWFHERGIPFVWPVVGYPEYHSDGDTLAAVDLADLEAVAEAAAGMVRDIASLV